MQARLAAERAAVFQKQQAVLQSDLDAATHELERLQQEQSTAAERVSPTDSEQVIVPFHRLACSKSLALRCLKFGAMSLSHTRSMPRAPSRTRPMGKDRGT